MSNWWFRLPHALSAPLAPRRENSCRHFAHSAETAEPIIFEIPREIAEIIARFSARFSMGIWEGHRMRGTDDNPIFYHQPSSKPALNPELPLIASPLHSCFPHQSSLFAAKASPCKPYVKTCRRPGAREVNTSQKSCGQGSAFPPLRASRSALVSLPLLRAPRFALPFLPRLPFGKRLQNPQPITCRRLTPKPFPASQRKIKKGKRNPPRERPTSDPRPLTSASTYRSANVGNTSPT